MKPATLFSVDTAAEIKTLTAALDGLTAVVVRCPGARFKAVATAIAKGAYPGVTDLELVISDFDPGEDIGPPALTAKASVALWQALPGLKRLRLRGHALCRGLDHDVLEVLEVEGFAFGDGAVPPAGACPRLRTLRWAFSGNNDGVAPEPDVIENLWTQRLPALVQLDLCDADVDGSLLDVASFLKAPLVKQLTTLGLPVGSTDGWKKVLKGLPTLTALQVRDPGLAGLDPRLLYVEPIETTGESDGTSGDVGDTIDLYGLDDKKLAKEKLLARTGPLRSLTLRWHWLEADGAKIVGQLAAAHPELETLNLNGPATGGWDAAALTAFVDNIDVHPGLKALHLRNNGLEGAGKTLVALLAKLPNLEVLELSQTDLTADDLAVVVPAVSRLKNLRVLLLGGVDGKSSTIITHTAAEAAARPRGIHVTTPSAELSNRINRAGDELRAAVDIYQTLSSSTLQRLELWSIGFKEHWPLVFAGVGARLPALQTLGLDGCRLSTAAVTALVSGLGKHEQLCSLDVQMAPTTAAYEALGTLLSCVSVTHLRLEEVTSAVERKERCDSAAIGRLAGARALTHLTIDIDGTDTTKHHALAKALAKIPTMQALAGWWPHEEDRVVLTELEDLLASSSIRTVKELDGLTSCSLLERNAVEAMWIDASEDLDEKLERRAAALKETSSLRSLVLFKGELTPANAKILVAVVSANTSLRSLTISLAMKATVAKDMVKRLSKLGRLETIALRGSDMSDAEKDGIVAAATGNTRVTFVDLGDGDWF